MTVWKSLSTWALLACMACSHEAAVHRDATVEGLRGACVRGADKTCGEETTTEGIGGGTVSLRIWALIAQGEFAEAQALITESVEAGLLPQTQAVRMLERIALLNTRLGQVPASLQRVKDFPSQLREYTLFQIKQLLERRDFTLATQAQLKLSEKLIEQQARLMEKVR